MTGGWLASTSCSATNDSPTGFGGEGGGSTTTSTTPTATGGSGQGGTILTTSMGGNGGHGGVIMNPCGTGCGDAELCDDAHLGLDDDCDGQVDEDCSCGLGQAHSCFKGDSSYHDAPGCFDGTMTCNELGMWGPCIGGVHATEGCFANDQMACHPITAVPFQNVDLKTGTGSFSANAVAGTESWTVSCPVGVNPCPAVNGANPPDDFKPLQSGEYSVTYTKGLMGGQTDSCTYPLFVGARGLRVELEWEHDLGSSGVDLDLHMHQPMTTTPWVLYGEQQQDCMYASCVFSNFSFQDPSAPHWFPDANVQPDPVNWYEDPVLEKNTCSFAPRGVGRQWQSLGQGCHNPRLDLDNITCDPTVSNVDDFDFCAPENINVDFPPKTDWTRIAVHYYSDHILPYDVHPNIKIYCDGQLAAELGTTGFYDGVTPVTFEQGSGSYPTRVWLVADVAFPEKADECSQKTCIVQPLYLDDQAKTPYFYDEDAAQANFGPVYPPPPMP